ncbi:hypothetical protein HYW72_02305 [Candidatus Nomurabacteria bacterium]|nr:hypothetical protein [Candidatus Nomurabacteria bacterium]
MKITFLDPPGANFTDIARRKLAELFNQRILLTADLELVKKNEEVLPTVIRHGGYGVVAMETIAEGRYDGPVGSFVHLLDHYQFSEACPTTVIAALKMRVEFALMARRGTRIEEVTEVLGHEKSFGACRRRIQERGWRFIQSPSNGKAAEQVAENPIFAKAVALGPRTAVEKYRRLCVFEENFEDEQAVTTFYLLGPKSKKHIVGLREVNLSLLVCRLLNKPGMLAKVVGAFGSFGINLRHIRDFHVGGDEYAHVIHFDCRKDQASAHLLAIQKAVRSFAMERYVLLGPFPVV